MRYLRFNKKEEIRFIGIIKASPPFHFYLMQFVGFAYLFYRFTSRDYASYGFLGSELFYYPRVFSFGLWPVPLSFITSFQFIYLFIPRPTYEVIYGLQWLVIGSCSLGIIGILPKWNALLSFLIALHLTGFMIASNSEVDGGTLALILLLILALSPSRNFYTPWKGFSLSARSPDYHWPVFLFFLFVGTLYTTSGLNKIIEIGPQWPFSFHLDYEAVYRLEQSIFLSSRFVYPPIVQYLQSYAFSVIGGIITLIAEMFFLTILILPRYRPFFVFSIVVMHVLVFNLNGINFVGSSVILLLCMDWNVLVRKATVYYRPDTTGSFEGKLRLIISMDWFDRLQLVPIADSQKVPADADTMVLNQHIQIKDENGDIYHDIYALEQMMARCPLLIPVCLFMKIPGMIYITDYFYGHMRK